MAVAKLNRVVETLLSGGKSQLNLSAENVADLTALYRFRFAAKKIGRVGFTGKEFDKRRNERKTAATSTFTDKETSWPKTTLSIDQMNADRTRVYLSRIVAHLNANNRYHDWRQTAFGNEETAEINLNPYENDHETNKEILRQLARVFRGRGDDDNDAGTDLSPNPWPPLPKPLEEMDFVDVAMYAQLLVIHLSGYRPNLGDPTDKPWYWGGTWGLPLNGDGEGAGRREWKDILGDKYDNESCPVNQWVEGQRSIIADIAQKYGPTTWANPDPSRNALYNEQYFPFMGKFSHYDLRAMSRFKLYAQLFSTTKGREEDRFLWTETTTFFPCLVIAKEDMSLTLMDIRGFLVELTIHLLGRQRGNWKVMEKTHIKSSSP